MSAQLYNLQASNASQENVKDFIMKNKQFERTSDTNQGNYSGSVNFDLSNLTSNTKFLSAKESGIIATLRTEATSTIEPTLI